jgi:hypothetical protein
MSEGVYCKLNVNLDEAKLLQEALSWCGDRRFDKITQRVCDIVESLAPPKPACKHVSAVWSPEQIQRVQEAANKIPFDWTGDRPWIADVIADDGFAERWTHHKPMLMRVEFKLIREDYDRKVYLMANDYILKEWRKPS